MAGIPKELSLRNRTDADGILAFAERLVRFDVLQRHHWRGETLNACTRAIEELTNTCHEHRFANFHIGYTDYADLGEASGYLYENKLRTNDNGVRVTAGHEPIGAFIIRQTTVMENGPTVISIGPAIDAIEQHHPRLGQTVMHALDSGLAASCRGLNPRNGILWASYNYWMGEEDETNALAEQFDELISEYGALNPAEKKAHEKPTEDDVDIFRRRDYVAAFPPWMTRRKLPTLSIPTVRRVAAAQRGQPAQILAAAAALLEWLAKGKDVSNDIGGFEQTSCDMCPYLLRWNNDDPLGQIWDDMMEQFSQTGEVLMDVNSIFAFHDDKTMARALRRLRNFLEVLSLTETLIQALAGRQRVRV
jgi:PRTRC genetic system protein F